jgi:hypothetical protein
MRSDALTLAAAIAGRAGSMAAVRLHQKYRMRAPSTGREVVIEVQPGHAYVDRETGEAFEVIAVQLPLAPSPSELPWAVENLRFCNWCDRLAQKDLNDCPHCARRMEPLGA